MTSPAVAAMGFASAQPSDEPSGKSVNSMIYAGPREDAGALTAIIRA